MDTPHPHTTLWNVAGTLTQIAREIEDTAKGSSRVAMYAALADQLRACATTIKAVVMQGPGGQ